MKPEDYGIGTREIKFRAWSKTDKELLPSYHFEDIGGWEGCCFGDFFDGEEYILMQYTGLKDKNGKESYEGDIYSCGHEYSDGTHKYGDRNVISNVRTFEPEDSFEVIGNIFENEDLLTKENA